MIRAWLCFSSRGINFKFQRPFFILGTTVEINSTQFECMIVFSTVLEIDGQPTLYNVYKNRGLAFLNPSRTTCGPILYASYENSTWNIKGTDDVIIKQQVMNEISITD